MIPDNDWYGHKHILSLYCGRLRPAAIFGTLMHGWRPGLAGSGHRRFSSAPLFVWNEMLVAESLRAGVPNVRAVGAPFLYLAELLRQSGPNHAQGTGTLCFPYHSAETVLVKQDHRRFIEHVEATEPGPYTASIFYQDMARPGYCDEFRNADWRITSFGTRSDPLFLFRLHAEILAHEVVIADQLGTSVWYAGALGRRVRIAPGTPTATRAGRADPLAHYASTFPALHNDGLEPRAAQEEALTQLGYESMLSPADLSTALGWRSRKRVYAFAVGKLIDKRLGPGPRLGDF